jgi:hypothetical protein
MLSYSKEEIEGYNPERVQEIWTKGSVFLRNIASRVANLSLIRYARQRRHISRPALQGRDEPI